MRELHAPDDGAARCPRTQHAALPFFSTIMGSQCAALDRGHAARAGCLRTLHYTMDALSPPPARAIGHLPVRCTA